mmetsp:Transcript_46239/g.142602  ORF Transcript_46239/g.142602 Transcript_46239/m.142602 type:complete len:232 (-) Transcript_46239:45-740(-)
MAPQHRRSTRRRVEHLQQVVHVLEPHRIRHRHGLCRSDGVHGLQRLRNRARSAARPGPAHVVGVLIVEAHDRHDTLIRRLVAAHHRRHHATARLRKRPTQRGVQVRGPAAVRHLVALPRQVHVGRRVVDDDLPTARVGQERVGAPQHHGVLRLLVLEARDDDVAPLRHRRVLVVHAARHLRPVALHLVHQLRRLGAAAAVNLQVHAVARLEGEVHQDRGADPARPDHPHVQ